MKKGFLEVPKMQMYNLQFPQESCSLGEAILRGLGKKRGLFFPEKILPLPNISSLLKEGDFPRRSALILSHLFGDEIPLPHLEEMTKKAFSFPVKLVEVESQRYSLELFHGPTLAFKDFGARLLAQLLLYLKKEEDPLTILCATSGDTGSAVAQAFYNLPGVRVVVLFPKGRVSPMQERLFSTLGGNVTSLAIEGDFDSCQDLLKESLIDPSLIKEIGLNSANSVNFARILGQLCYYAETLHQLGWQEGNRVNFSVPCGNFGNLFAGLLTSVLLQPEGLQSPSLDFTVACNANDTVPRYLSSGEWRIDKTRATLANAMDISDPSNWPRILQLAKEGKISLERLSFGSLNDIETKEAMRELSEKNGYIADPHTAIAYRVQREREDREEATNVFLSTAHPAKFQSTVEDALATKISLPKEISDVAKRVSFTQDFPSDTKKMRDFLLDTCRI